MWFDFRLMVTAALCYGCSHSRSVWEPNFMYNKGCLMFMWILYWYLAYRKSSFYVTTCHRILVSEGRGSGATSHRRATARPSFDADDLIKFASRIGSG
ncbi:hypothetical protein Hanom_Chr01g00036181 [Helianthus anomalus]